MTFKETIGKLDGQVLYQYLTKPAGWLKVSLQMLVGVAAIIIIVFSLVSDMRHGRTAGSVSQHAIAIIAASLAVAASLELAYTLFTDGPDEVIDPLMMGVSATLLFLVSTLTALTWTAGVAVVLFAGALAMLFAIRQRFIDKTSKGNPEGYSARKLQIEKIFVKPEEAAAALDLLELADFAWHDLYGDNGLPAKKINDILSPGCQLVDLVVAVKSAVENYGAFPSPEIPRQVALGDDTLTAQ